MNKLPDRIGKYKIIREIGRGATAVVYLAHNPHYPEPVAVKHIRFDDKARDEAKWNRRLLKLMKAEKAVSSRLDHPNIIRIFDTVVDADESYVVMEYFNGLTLERYTSFDNLLPVHRVIGIVFKCCMALDYAFRQGIVHRDIKPANILVDDQDNVKITDFGLALNVGKKVEADSTFIMGVGSPAYMSPEQIKGYPLNQKTDLYSLGVVLFHLLAGRLPFRAKNPAQLVYKIINADPPSLCQLNPDLPELIDQVMRKSLEKDLYSRYKNGAEFAKDLSAVRYKIVDADFRPPDTTRFSALRRQVFFTDFDDIEVWETLRISTWRTTQPHALLIREGAQDQRFGIILEGSVELSIGGRRLCELGPGEVFGELAFLDAIDNRQSATVVAITPLVFLEVNPAALALATEEVQELFRSRLATEAARRLAAAQAQLARDGAPAQQGSLTASSFDLQIVDD